MLTRLVRWSLDQPRLIAGACLILLVAAAFYVRDIDLAFLPQTQPVFAEVQTEAPGLVSEQVEQLVTRPVESALAGTLGVAHVHSQSVQGLSLVRLTFAAGADPARTRQALLENLSALGDRLPPGVASPRLWPMRAQGGPLLQVGFLSGKLDPMALRDVIDWTVRPRLLATPGVSDVTVLGGQVRRLEVRARPGDLSDSDLGFLDILNAVRRSTGVAGAGFIDTPNQRVVIEPHGQALTTDAVGAGQIQTPGAAPVRINDVADVVEAPAPGFGDALIDGQPGVIVSVSGQYGANGLRTTRAVEQALDVLQPALVAQQVVVRRDLERPATFTADIMRAVGIDLAVGVALVALALIFALRDLRAALVALVTMPLAFLIALAALKALGWGLNAMTLGGLAVALGVVIDDAVIDVENIVARLRDAEHGHGSAPDAILAASLEVRGPVVYATLAMIAAVLPLLLLGGPQGVLLRPFAGAVIAGSLASLLVAAVVTPALATLALRHLAPEPAPRRRFWGSIHRGGLARLEGPRAAVVVVSLLLAIALVVGLMFARPELLPPLQDGHLTIAVTSPASTSLAAMRDSGARVASDLKRLSGVRSVSERIGRDPSGAGAAGLSAATFDLGLATGLSASAQAAVGRRAAALLRTDWGLQPDVRSGLDSAPQDDASDAAFAVSVYGPDLDALDATAGQIAGALRRVAGGQTARVASDVRAPVVRVDLNFNRLAIFGLSVGDVLDTVQAAFAGERVAQVYVDDRAIDLAISAQASLRQDPETVGDLLLRSTSGVSVPLKSVANVYLTEGRAEISHDDGLRRQVVIADPTGRAASGFAAAAQAAIIHGVTLTRGEFLDYALADRAAAQARRNLAVSYGLALLAVFAILTVALDGRSAAVIVASTLFSLMGGALAVYALGGSVSVGPIAGLIALFGIAIRTSLLLIARLEDLVIDERQPWSFEIVMRAAQDRAAPLLLSSALVALALAPLAVQAGRGGFEILGPMAIVVIAGLITGAAAGLFVTPLMVFMLWRPGYARLARGHRASTDPTHGGQPS